MNPKERIKEEIQKFLRTEEGQQLSNTGFEVHETIMVNVLVVGRTQVGKTTLVNALKDNTYAGELRSYSDTEDAKDHPIIIRHKDDNRYYHINMIDTVGLDEKSRDSTINRPNEEILQLNAKFVEKSITTLNVVIFVSRAGCIHLHELQALRLLMDFLGSSFSERSMMVLTHCEGFTRDKFNDLVRDIRESPQSKDVWDYCKLGIHPHGTINLNQLETMIGDDDKDLRIGTIKKDLRMVMPMRRVILESIVAHHAQPKTVGDLGEVMKLANQARMQFAEKEILQRIQDGKLKKTCIIS